MMMRIKLNIAVLGSVIIVQTVMVVRITMKDLCSVIPRIVYNFEIQNLATSEDNLKYRGDVSLVAYCDFETTARTDSCIDPKNRNVSYVITFAFHPEMNLDRVSQKGHLLIAWIN